MIRIGLTGGIGSGKSTVTKMLIKKNIKVIDADLIAREVLDIYPKLKEEIKNSFGKEFFDASGNLLRRKLGELVFNSEDKRAQLENIILPFIIKEITYRLNELEDIGERIAFVDAPLLIETGIYKDMDYNVLVYVDKETQINRVMERDGFSKEHTLKRIEAQIDLDDKKNFVDYIIDNSGSIANTKNQLEQILNKWGNDE